MIEFRALASSSEGNAYLVTHEGSAPLLIDCGIRFAEIQQALDFKVSGLAGCLISHAHGDHCKAVKDLLKMGVDCFASPQTWDSLQIFNHQAWNARHMERWPIRETGWAITPFDAVHDLEGTLGFVVDHKVSGERLVYLTDSAYSRHRFEGVTIFAVECNHSSEIMRDRARSGSLDTDRYKRVSTTHMSVERLIGMLEANDLSQCREIHLLHLSDGNSDERAFKEKVQAATGVPTFVAAKRLEMEPF